MSSNEFLSDDKSHFIKVDYPREIARLNQFDKMRNIRGGSYLERNDGTMGYVQPRMLENQRPRMAVFEYAKSSPACCPKQYTNSLGCICSSAPIQPTEFYSFVDEDGSGNGISPNEIHLPKGGIMN